MNKTKNKFFSLIELIVVIAVLAILATLLQPSLVSALRNARTLECKKNLMHVGVAMDLYVQDHNYYPYATFRTNPRFLFGSWDDLLGQGYDGRNLNTKEVNYPNSNVENSIYTCPQQKDELNSTSSFLRSYALNCNQSSKNMGGFSSLWGFGDNPISVSLHDVPAPSSTILLLEMTGTLGSGYQNAGVYGAATQSNAFKNNPERYHQGLSNYLFADNHIEILLPEETRNPNKNNWVMGKFWTRDPDD